MKVIAKTTDETFLVEATAREIGQMFGDSYKRACDIKLGMQFDVAGLFKHNQQIAAAADKVKLLRSTLHALDQTLAVLEPEIKTLTEEGSQS